VSAFTDELDRFLAGLFRIDPLRATSVGMHEYDAEWPDLSEAGRAALMDFVDAWEARFAGFDSTGLTADEAADRDLVLMELAAYRFGERDLQEDRWDPLAWVYLLGDGIFPLLAREFAPLDARLTSAARRIAGIWAILLEARRGLRAPDDRPVSRLHTETALRQLAGIDELIGDALEQAAGSDDPAVREVRPFLEHAAADARRALAEFEVFLRDELLPISRGEGRLGPELFARKLGHTLRSGHTVDEVLRRAEAEYTAVRAEMVRVARSMWPAAFPDRAMPASDTDLVRAVLDDVGLQHPRADDLLQFCRDELVRVEAFVRTRDLIGLAPDPLEIRWTPVFLRAFGGAMLDSPGPLDQGQKAFFAITPVPEDWTEEQAESYLREDNDRMLRLLTIHEAVPGHYLQGVYANRCPSLARSIFWSGVFAEGWAVYVTQVMLDVGYGGDDPALLLTHWKFYLRAVINAIIDVRIHTQNMTEDEAVRLMVEGGFQEESEARNKWNRARLTSTQLSTYFVGSVEMWDIELEARRRAAERAGASGGRAAIADPALPGGFGDTPGFAYRPHLEAVIAHGAPPTSLLRRILFN
jgi:uncharacterized protein (DUF885 family)